ncbi:MAG TPA: MFS transporter [Acidimicrobiales bacterium]|nr:MFS transporter [Acidimicrobiales bacterium]
MRRPWRILGVLCVSLLMIGLDNTILSVALPTLVRQLHASSSQLQWIVDSYTIVFAGLLLVAGSLGDRFGRKWALLAGLGIFNLGSLLSAFAGSPEVLIATRALMGVGGAFVMPATLSILTNVFVDPGQREKAIGIWAGVSGVGVAIGPIAGGLLLQHFWWGSVFLINVPVVAAGMVAGAVLVPNSADPRAPRLDPVGSALSIVGLSVLLWGIIEAPMTGWMSPRVIGGMVAGIVILAAFLAWELYTDHPMLNLGFFRNRRFSSACAAVSLVMFGLFGALFVLTQHLQFVMGYSALEAGIRFIPLAGMLLLGGPLSTLLVRRFGTKAVAAGGMTIVAGAFAWMATVTDGSPYLAHILGPILLMGLGMGLTMAPAIEAIMGSLPRAQAGVGSAMNSSVMQVGGALGVAVIGSVLASGYRSVVGGVLAGHAVPPIAATAIKSSVGGALEVAHRAPAALGAALASVARHGFVHGIGLAMPVAAGVALAGAVVVVIFLPARAEGDPDAGLGGEESLGEPVVEPSEEEAPEWVPIGARR